MAERDFDLFVIGAGSGGVRAARIAASLGARVAVAESGPTGGTCVNAGCIPKKLLVYGSQFGEHAEDGTHYGWHFGEHRFSWPRLIAAKDTEIRRLNAVYEGILTRHGVTLLRGRAVVTGPHSVELAGRAITAENILVAVGGRPFVPEDLPGHELCITSDDLFHLPELPARTLVVGGGYVACELAGVLSRLGSQVTLSYRGDLLLRGFDVDCRSALTEAVEAGPMDLRLRSAVRRITRQDDGALEAELSDESTVTVDQVLMAIGRRPNTHGLGLDSAGVDLGERGEVKVDLYLCTTVPSIYAVGDVTDRVTLTPVALAEGQAVARNLFGNRHERLDYSHVPTAVFTEPEVACVGLTEEAAIERSLPVDVYVSRFRPLLHTLTGRPVTSMMKLLVDRRNDQVLGVHVAGEHAAEIVQGMAVAMTCRATKAQLDATLGIHPTAAEELVTMRTRTRSIGEPPDAPGTPKAART